MARLPELSITKFLNCSFDKRDGKILGIEICCESIFNLLTDNTGQINIPLNEKRS